MTPSASFVILGAGFVGTRLAQVLSANGKVMAVTSSPASAKAAATTGASAVAWNLDTSAPRPAALSFVDTTVFYLVPPPAAGGSDPRLRRLLASLNAAPRRFIYMSTTAVYGDADGATVNEDAVLSPGTDRGRRRLDAETALRRYCDDRDIPWTILRVPGIYGPDRLPLDRLRRGDPAIRPEESGPGNRIHVDDLVTACVLVGTHPAAAKRIYNVSDGDAASMTSFLQTTAELTGLPPPPLVSRARAQQEVSSTMWSYMSESRRIDSQRIRDELGFVPQHASHVDGIRASLATFAHGDVQRSLL